MEPDKISGSSPGPDVIVALTGISGHPDQHDTSGSKAPNANMSPGGSPDPGHLIDLQWLNESWTPTQAHIPGTLRTFRVLGARHLNTESCYCVTTIDHNMGLSSSLSSNISIQAIHICMFLIILSP